MMIQPEQRKTQESLPTSFKDETWLASWCRTFSPRLLFMKSLQSENKNFVAFIGGGEKTTSEHETEEETQETNV